MTEIQQNRYDQLFRRVNNIVAPGSMVGDALSELFPVIDVERVPGELLALMGTDICVGASTLLGAALQVPHIQIFNPIGSGKIITVTKLIVSIDGNTRVRLATNNIALSTGISTQVYRDRRKIVTSRPTGTLRQQSLVALADANWQFRVIADTSFTLEDENGIAVLNPGSGLEASPVLAASEMTMTYMWRERVAEPAELSL